MCFKALPGPVLDENPELIVPQKVLQKLLAQEDLHTPERHLQMYCSPLHISMDFGNRQLPAALSYWTWISGKD